jgi:hypothetical protein
MSDQPTIPRAHRSLAELSKLLEEKSAPQSYLPVEVEAYLPPDLWRKINENPRRGLLNNALNRMQTQLYTIST